MRKYYENNLHNNLHLPALRIINDYLSNRQQRTKINHPYCSWEEVVFGVVHGSIFLPILFNIFLSDLFLIIDETEFASYADDSTFYDAGNINLFKWFFDNKMQDNSAKCYLILSADEPTEIQVGECLI